MVEVRQYAQRPLAQAKQVAVVGVANVGVTNVGMTNVGIADGTTTTCCDAEINALINSSSPALDGQYDQSAL